jgi:hypothetical protein
MSRSWFKIDGSLEYYLQTEVRLTMPEAKNKIIPSGSIKKQRNVLTPIDEREHCTIELLKMSVPGVLPSFAHFLLTKPSRRFIESYGTVYHRRQETPARPAPDWGFLLHYRSTHGGSSWSLPRPVPY